MKTALSVILTILIISAVQKIPVPKFYTEYMGELGTKIAKNIKKTQGLKRCFWFVVAFIIPACFGLVFVLIFKNINQIINNL